MSELIHPTAVVSPKARIGNGTRIGPFCTVDDNVVLGERCELKSHVVLEGHVTLGDEVTIYPFSVIGGAPQHFGYKGEPTTVVVGSKTILRESVTIHRGTSFGAGTTVVGEDCLLMAYTHVAHDCVVGKGVILANGVQLAGHSTVGDFATIGGLTGVAQYCRVGQYCYLGGASMIRKDIPPFLVGKGNDFEVQGINVVGLERRGFNTDTVQRLRKVFKIFYRQNLTVVAATDKILTELGQTDEVKAFLDFVRGSKLGFER